MTRSSRKLRICAYVHTHNQYSARALVHGFRYPWSLLKHASVWCWHNRPWTSNLEYEFRVLHLSKVSLSKPQLEAARGRVVDHILAWPTPKVVLIALSNWSSECQRSDNTVQVYFSNDKAHFDVGSIYIDAIERWKIRKTNSLAQTSIIF